MILHSAHQAEDGRERSPSVVVAAAELEVEQERVVRHQVETVCVHQRLTAQSVARLETWRVDPTWRERENSPLMPKPSEHRDMTPTRLEPTDTSSIRHSHLESWQHDVSSLANS